MNVRVLLFASLREAASTSEMSLTLGPGSPVSAVLGELGQRLPHQRELLGRCALAVNAEYSDSERPLEEGDTVAVIPPVSGGASRPEEERGFPELMRECTSK